MRELQLSEESINQWAEKKMVTDMGERELPRSMFANPDRCTQPYE